ncbi:MAG: HEAT repeat domain-containing protein [Planctomycetes bacterium]|nr:HEAT repeat domain-containing protein [Planctomycetota bacterium]
MSPFSRHLSAILLLPVLALPGASSEEAARQAAPVELTAEESARLEDLCRRLGDGDEGRRWESARTLVQEGPKAVSALSAILRGGWSEGRKMAAWTLGQIGSEAGAPALAGALGDPDSDVRWKAAISLVQIGLPALPWLRQELQSESSRARQCAAWALGQLRAEAAGSDLAKTLSDPDEEVRWKAAVSLTQLGKAALPLLVHELAAPNEQARQCAVWALGELGPQVTDEVVDLLARDPDATVRAKAAVAAASLQGELGTRLAAALRRDTDPLVRKEAMLSLAKLHARAAGDAPSGTPEVGLNAVFDARFAIEEGEMPQGLGPEVEWTDAGGRVGRVRSFRSGPGQATARLAADEPGLWYLEEAAAASPGTPRLQGVFRVLDRAEFPGRLRVRKNSPPGLELGTGISYFPIGGGTKGLNGRRPEGGPAHSIEDWKNFLEACGQHGINHLRLFLLETPWVAPQEVARHPEYCPWRLDPKSLKYDLERFEPAFWDKLDQVLQAALRASVVIELVVFDEVGLDAGQGNRWDLHPFNEKLGGAVAGQARGWPAFYDLDSGRNRRAQEAYLGYLVARTAAYPNVYYQLNNEMGAGDAGNLGVEWLRQGLAFLDRHDPWKRPRSLSTLAGGRRYLSMAGIDVVNLHGDSPQRLKGLEKPHMLSLPLAENEREERELFWRGLLGGVAAARRAWLPLATEDAFFRVSEGLRLVLRGVDAWSFEPRPQAVLSIPPGIRADSGVHAGVLWIYLSGVSRGGGSLRLGYPGERFRARWIQPATGKVLHEALKGPAEGMLELTPPDFEGDLLLLLEPASPDVLRTTAGEG